MNKHVAQRIAASIVGLACLSAGCRSGTTDDARTSGTIKLAFVTNNATDFWTVARRGVEKDDTELADVETEFPRWS